MTIVNDTPIQVFTNPGCGPCTATKAALKKMGLTEGKDYIVTDLSQDENALEKIKDWGHTSAPVVFDGFEHWSGFQPERLANAVARRYPNPDPLF